MIRKSSQAHSRADRVLVAALAVVLATASAAVGAAVSNPSHQPVIHVTQVVQPVEVVQKVVRTVVAPVASPISMKQRNDIVLAQLLAEHRCLSEVMYYEARGEGQEGQKAVAEVVFHRMNHGNYGHSICAVVYEGAGKPGCQFTFTCNGQLALPKSAEDWHETQVLAARILTGEVKLADTTGDAIFYHATSVQPGWDNTLQRTVQIGNHIFYRERSRAM